MEEALHLFGEEKLSLINIVTNVHNEILGVYAGHPIKAFRKATEHVRKQYSVNLDKHYDIVIACSSGHPSDMNFYQASKALALTMLVAKDEADYFMIAECEDGMGCEIDLFRKWSSLKSDEFINMFNNEYDILGTGPYIIDLMHQRGCSLYLVTDYMDDMTDFLRMGKVSSNDFGMRLKECVDKYNHIGIIPSIAIIPYASHCYINLNDRNEKLGNVHS